jgi:hypothetical protein
MKQSLLVLFILVACGENQNRKSASLEDQESIKLKKEVSKSKDAKTEIEPGESAAFELDCPYKELSENAYSKIQTSSFSGIYANATGLSTIFESDYNDWSKRESKYIRNQYLDLHAIDVTLTWRQDPQNYLAYIFEAKYKCHGYLGATENNGTPEMKSITSTYIFSKKIDIHESYSDHFNHQNHDQFFEFTNEMREKLENACEKVKNEDFVGFKCQTDFSQPE